MHTIYGEFALLTGKSAPPEFLHLVTYKCMTFADEITSLDTVRAYHVRLPVTIVTILQLYSNSS